MEESIKKATFRFEGYKILRSNFEKRTNEEGREISIGFNPRGIISKSESTFELEVDVVTKDDNDSFEVNLTAVGSFSFANLELDGDNLNPFFLINAPALLFPYVRAYITTLTALSGISPVILPTINLTGMKETLLKNITVIE